MDDSLDELQRSHDRLFPPSSPIKQPGSGRNTGALSSTGRRHDTKSPSLPQAQSFLLETPARTGGGASATSTSPMRIRVTVEAEPSATPIGLDGVDERHIDPQARTFDTGTTTITIPLKGEDEHKPVKRRGRPRKSLDSTALATAQGKQQDTPKAVKGTPKPRKNAKGTPAPTRTRQTRSSIKNNNDIPTQDGPSPIAAANTNQPVAKRTRRQSNAVDAVSAISTTPQDPVPAAQRRKPLDFANITPLHHKNNVVETLQTQDASFFAITPPAEKKARQELATKKIKERVGTPRKVPTRLPYTAFVGSSPVRKADPPVPQSPRQRRDADGENGEEDQDDELEVDHDEVENEDDEESGDSGDEGMTGLEDDTSVLDRSAVESEGFSMVSIDSLRSHKRLAEAEAHPKQPSRLRIEQSIHEVNEEEDAVQQPTIAIDRRPRSQSPVRDSKQPISKKNPSTHQGSIFDSFRADAARSAGPRSHQSQARLPTPAASDDAREDDSEVQQLRPRPSPQRVQLEVENNTSVGKSSFKHFDSETQAPITPATSSHDEHSELGRTQLFEQQIQREREEVIRQAETANASQVVVIEDTTMADVDVSEEQDTFLANNQDSQALSQARRSPQHREPGKGDSGVGLPERAEAEDMWLDEADRSIESSMISRPSRRHLKRKVEEHVEVQEAGSLTQNLEQLFTGDDGPRRAKIPRTWRRVSGTGFLYSDEVASPPKPVQAVEHSQLRAVPEATADVWLEMPPAERAEGRAARAKKARGTQVQRSRLSSSPKRVSAFDNAAAKGTPMANEQYFSESEEHGVRDDAGEASTFDAPGYESYVQDEDIIHQSIEEDDYVEDSHARQLRRELVATTPRRMQSQKPQHSPAATNQKIHNEQDEHKSQLLLRKPGKVYAPLFEAMSHPESRLLSSPPQKASPAILPPSLAAVPPFSSSTAPLESEPQPGLLTRLTSWFFPAPQPPQATTPLSSIPWNRNHYLVLDHYYKLIVHRPDKPAPDAYMVSWNTIPRSLRNLLGVEFVTFADGNGSGRRSRGWGRAKEKWPAVVSEEWIRIARCFVEEARVKGVPVLCDGRMDPRAGERIRRAKRERRRRGEGQLDAEVEEEEEEKVEGDEWKDDVGNGYPVRDAETGRVKRIKQDWRGEAEAEEVLKRVYSLWVLEMMRGVGEVVPREIGVERYA